MFGRWLHKQKPQLPDLDREVATQWNRGIAPSKGPMPEEASATSLDFASADYSTPKKTKEHTRRRRRLAWSLLVGMVLGPIMVGAAYYLMRYINPVIRATEPLGERMTFGPQDEEEIFYTEDISPEQARQLGAFLEHEVIFDGLSAKSVRLSRNGAVFVVGFALEWNSWKRPEVVEFFRELRTRLSSGVFHGSPVEIHLCARQADSKGQPLPAMHILRADDHP